MSPDAKAHRQVDVQNRLVPKDEDVERKAHWQNEHDTMMADLAALMKQVEAK